MVEFCWNALAANDFLVWGGGNTECVGPKEFPNHMKPIHPPSPSLIQAQTLIRQTRLSIAQLIIFLVLLMAVTNVH
jgi:hypothetical protein